MINNLLQVENDRVLATSLKVAESFEKRHDNVLRLIDKMIEDIGLLKIEETPSFEKSYYRNDQNGESYPMYLMDKDAFALLTMGFTGKKALEWKIKYIKAFNDMEQRLHSSTPLQDNRLDIARIISRTSRTGIEAIKEMYPEYFTLTGPTSNLEQISDRNTSYRHWLEDYGITKDWIENFPTSDIFNSYMRYCVENHLRGMGKKIFYATLESDFGLSKKQLADGKRYFVTA